MKKAALLTVNIFRPRPKVTRNVTCYSLEAARQQQENTMKNNLPDKQSNFLLYTGSDGKVNVEVFLKDETVWLTQKEIGRLFGKSKATISEHLKKIYADGELQMDSTVRKFRTVQMEGSGKIMKSDVSVAKNYLNEAHIKELNRIVSAYLDLAENRAERQILMKMEDWVQFLHNFLELSNYPILEDKGKVSAIEAKLKAEQ